MNLITIFGRLPRVLRRQRVINLMLRISPSSRFGAIPLGDGTRFHGDLRQRGPRHALIEGYRDPEYIRVARAFLAGNTTQPVMFDIGANFGIYSFALISSVPGLDIHLFEANPELCEHLRKSAALNPQNKIRVTNACITRERSGVSRFQVDAGNTGVSHISDSGGIEVPNLALADYLETEGIEEITFAKIDIEGFEVHGFAGLLNPANDGVLKAAVMEVVTNHLKRAGSTTAGLFELLHDRGFRLFHFRSDDFEGGGYNSFRIDKAERRPWLVNGQRIELVSLDAQRAAREGWIFGTDILAVHQTCTMTQAHTAARTE